MILWRSSRLTLFITAFVPLDILAAGQPACRCHTYAISLQSAFPASAPNRLRSLRHTKSTFTGNTQPIKPDAGCYAPSRHVGVPTITRLDRGSPITFIGRLFQSHRHDNSSASEHEFDLYCLSAWSLTIFSFAQTDKIAPAVAISPTPGSFQTAILRHICGFFSLPAFNTAPSYKHAC